MDIAKRIEQMKASRELGRCVCSTPMHAFTCPCAFMKEKGICHCAGEEHEGYTNEEWTKFNLKTTD